MTKAPPNSSTLSTPKEEKKENAQQTQRNLADSEERFQLLVESVSDYAIFLLDPNGYVQSWNAGAQRFKGYKAEEAIGKHFSIFYTQKDIDRQHPQNELTIALKEGRFEEEGWRVRQDGSQFWANVVITKLVNSGGQLVGFAKVTRDLTQKMLAEEQLKFSEERYRLLVSAVKDYAIFMIDPEGYVATWNEGAQRLKGYLPEEIIGQHFSKFYPTAEIRSKKPEWELEEATMTGRFEDEGWRVRKDGTHFWANVTLTAIKNKDGKMLGFSKVTRDMTERRRLEERLRRSNEDLDERVRERTAQLEHAIRARDEFLSIASHELRTPMTSLKLQVQMAQRQIEKNDPQAFHEKTKKFILGAGRQLDRIVGLIDNMLDVSKISMDRLNVDKRPIDLCEVIQEATGHFEEQFLSAGCVMTLKCEGPIPVYGDSSRLDQVFSNLLMNALKYGGGRPVAIITHVGPSKVLIEFHDQGMGIAKDDQARIFDRFERAVSANTVSGMGLGLFISRKIVEAHQGEILLQSEPGKGSVFTVTLPLSTGTQQAAGNDRKAP